MPGILDDRKLVSPAVSHSGAQRSDVSGLIASAHHQVAAVEPARGLLRTRI
jgi:hypothetical protein